MNLFALAWRPDDVMRERLAAEVAARRADFGLDPATAWSTQGAEFAAAGMHVAGRASAPRRWVARAGSRVTFFDGVAADASAGAGATDGIGALDAADLGRRFLELPERLEGRFCIARCDEAAGRVDVLLDPLGMFPVYAARAGASMVLSNSARIAARLAGRSVLDRTGAALFAALGWIPGDRTLIEGVSVLRGGRTLTFAEGCAAPAERAHFAPRSIAADASRAAAAEVAAPLLALVRAWFRERPDTRCPLTAGRDSRALAALCRAAGLDPVHVTRGRAEDPDVCVAHRLARLMGWKHELSVVDPARARDGFFAASARVVALGDGEISAWQFADVLDEPAPAGERTSMLGGIGGEIARRFYSRPELLDPALDHVAAAALLVRVVLGKERGLSTEDARRAAEASLGATITALADDGVVPRDLPDAFYAWERVRRWGGANARKVAPRMDTFAPFVSRVFVHAAFAIPAHERATEPLHREIVRAARDPRLLREPFDHGAWVEPSRWRRWTWAGHRGGRSEPTPLQETVFAARRGEIARALLERARPELFDVVDRAALERLLTDEGFARRGKRDLQRLYAAWTLVEAQDLFAG